MGKDSANNIDGSKAKVKRVLFVGLINALEKGDVTVGNIRSVARELLSGIDRAESTGDIVDFLDVIRKKWSFASDAYGRAVSLKKDPSESEIELMDKLSSYIIRQ
jgi:hypothetical protein